jgi:hypothetical protein
MLPHCTIPANGIVKVEAAGQNSRMTSQLPSDQGLRQRSSVTPSRRFSRVDVDGTGAAAELMTLPNESGDRVKFLISPNSRL